MSPRQVLAVSLFALSVASLPGHAEPAHDFSFGAPASAREAGRTVEITMVDMKFEPSAIEIKPGETVRFVIRNEGSLPHEFNLGTAVMHAEHQKEMQQMQAMGMLSATSVSPQGMEHMDHDMAGMDHGAAMKHDDPNSVLVAPGKSAELTWTFGEAVSLEFACNIPGHYQAGMVGNLVVKS